MFLRHSKPGRLQLWHHGTRSREPERRSEGNQEVCQGESFRIDGDSRVRGWAFDAGVTGDAFILKGGFIETMDVMKDELFVHGGDKPELIVMNKRPIVDIVIVWQPQKGIAIDYLNVGDVLGALLEKFPNSRFAYSDKYNSEKLRQEVMTKGVDMRDTTLFKRSTNAALH